MGWTLAELRALTPDEFDELVEWAHERSKPPAEEGTIDADEVVRGLDEKKRKAEELAEGNGAGSYDGFSHGGI